MHLQKKIILKVLKTQVSGGVLLLSFEMFREKDWKNAKMYTRQTCQTSHNGHSIANRV